jgi:hypothetical protein
MMFLIALENGQPTGNPLALDNFKQVNPSVSLPFPLLPEHIEPYGYGIYDFSMPPEHGVFEKLEEVGPVKSPDNGVYYQTRIVVPMNEEEIAARTEQEWAAVRAQRNHRLIACDWTQLPDAPLTDAKAANWGSYRQALRDITNQSDPFNIEWPVPPLSGE